MPYKLEEKLAARFIKKLEKKLHGSCVTLPFTRELWEYRTLVEKKKTRKLNRILITMARYMKEKHLSSYPTKVEEFMKECEDSDSSYCRDESVLSEGYYVSQKIYTGSPGVKIYMCERSMFSKKPKNPTVAVKIINLKKVFDSYININLRKELDVILQVQHPFIIETICVLYRLKQYYIFMRYAERSDLFSYLVNSGPVSESDARLWTAQIGSALTFLHSLNIAHTDVSCENILLTEHFNLKLTDFEHAVRIQYEMANPVPLQNFQGSSEYATPEILQGRPYSAFGADTWALGVVLYAMVTAHLPFCGETDEENMHRRLAALSADHPRSMYELENVRLLMSQRNWKMKDTNYFSRDLVILFFKTFRFKSKHRYNLQRTMHSEWFKKEKRFAVDGDISMKWRPKTHDFRPFDDPGRMRLVNDPAQMENDVAEVIQFHPFVRQTPSETTLIPILHTEEDLGRTFSDDQSFGIPYRPGQEQARNLSNLERLWKLKQTSKKNHKSKSSKKGFAKLLYKAYQAVKEDTDEE